MSSSKKTASQNNDQPQINTSSHSSAPKHRRRKRDDLINRNYTCGCGKSYLSYPALYTHLKQKHDGKQPHGTILPSSNRGRKPKNPQEEDDREEDKEDKGFHKPEEDKIDEFLTYLSGYSCYLKNTYNKELSFLSDKPEEDFHIAFLHFPRNLINPQEDLTFLYQNLEQLDKDPKSFEEIIDRDTGLKKTSINRIFALFLFKISRFLSKQAYIEIALYIILYRKTLNSIGWRLKDSNGASVDGGIIGEFCESYNSDAILQASNELITKFLPGFIEEINIELELIGSSEEKVKNVVYLTQYFGNWLFANYYTNLKLDINYE